MIARFNKLLNARGLELFLLLSPLIDVITSLSVKFLGISATFGTLVRGCLLLYFVWYVFFKSKFKYKKVSIIFLLIIFLYMFIFTFNMFLIKDTCLLFSEIKQLFKTFYFPIMLIGFINYFHDHVFDYKTLKNVAFIYAIFVFVPVVLGLSFPAYNSTGVGCKGWFYAANELGAIIAILFPFVVYDFISENKHKSDYVFYVMYIYVMLQIGTKVPLLGLFMTIFSFLCFYLFKFLIRKNKKEKIQLKKPIVLPLLLSIAVVPILFGISSSSKILSNRINDLEGEKVPVEEKVNDFIFSSRDEYNKEVKKEYMKADTKEKLLGMGINNISPNSDREFNMIEIDYFDIFYQYGILGFVIYFTTFLVVSIYSLKNLLQSPENILVEKNVTRIIAILLALGIAFFAGHVLIAPSVSVLLAIMITINKEEKKI